MAPIDSNYIAYTCSKYCSCVTITLLELIQLLEIYSVGTRRKPNHKLKLNLYVYPKPARTQVSTTLSYNCREVVTNYRSGILLLVPILSWPLFLPQLRHVHISYAHMTIRLCLLPHIPDLILNLRKTYF